MMKLYSVRDKVMERCAPPFAAPNDATAIRVFKNLGFPKESPITDFELVFIGDFDETESNYAKIYEHVEAIDFAQIREAFTEGGKGG